MMTNLPHHQVQPEEIIFLLKRMLDPDDLGFAVTQEVREQIRTVLKLKEEVKTQ